MKKSRSTSPSAKSNARLYERCAVLGQVVRAIKPIYSAPSATANQKQLLETMIGAAIWYFPQPSELWTGRISLEAAKAVQGGNRPTRDHEYPRKIAARELLSRDDTQLTADEIYVVYCQKFGRFNLVTKEENRKLMQYQRAETFASPEECYAKAGIQLVDAHSLVDKINAIREGQRGF